MPYMICDDLGRWYYAGNDKWSAEPTDALKFSDNAYAWRAVTELVWSVDCPSKNLQVIWRRPDDLVVSAKRTRVQAHVRRLKKTIVVENPEDAVSVIIAEWSLVHAAANGDIDVDVPVSHPLARALLAQASEEAPIRCNEYDFWTETVE